MVTEKMYDKLAELVVKKGANVPTYVLEYLLRTCRMRLL